jgi:flagellar basal body P-ring formation protein FlgA
MMRRTPLNAAMLIPDVRARHLILAALATLVFIFTMTIVSVQAQTPLAPRLKAIAVVESDSVRLSDLVEGMDMRGDMALFGAPQPGQAGAISTSRIISAARDHGIAGIETGGLSSVVVRRAGRRISPEDIAAALKQVLVRDHQVVTDAELELTSGQMEVTVEASSTEAVSIRSMNYSGSSGRFEATFVVPGNRALELQPARIVGTVADVARVPVLTRAILKGDVVSISDFTMERRRRSEMNGDVVTDATKLADTVAKRALPRGTIMRDADVQRPDAIDRNAAVTLVYEQPGLQLTLRGRALQAGTLGDVIQVQNVTSKKIVEGTITAPGRVTVAPGSAPALTASASRPNTRTP